MAVAAESIPAALFDEAARPFRFLQSNYASLLRDYPEQFVAINGGRVVASEMDLRRLWFTLQAMGLIVRTDVTLHFISAGSASMLL